MCNLYRQRRAPAEIARLFDADLLDGLPDVASEIYPKRTALVIRQDEYRIVDAMTWGFPPPVAASGPVTNVRNLSSPFWRNALSNPARRCLVPVDEFCEWEGAKGSKIKRWFSVPSLPVFAFAGIWRPAEDGPKFAFLTCEPNPLVAPIHPKAMPVILQPDDYDRWLGGEDAAILALPFPSQLMTVA
jgi:putative SOS response-associated peptidase YedK